MKNDINDDDEYRRDVNEGRDCRVGNRIDEDT